MYSIGIVGDVHIDTGVSSRRDNYFQTCLDKISEVANNCKHIIFLGDLFNRESLPSEYFYQLYIHLNYLKNINGNVFYSIIGNHDIPNENEKNLNKTTLGLCKLTGLLNLIEVHNPVNIEGINFYTSYVNLDKCREHLKTLKLNSNDVLLLHQYFEDGFPGIELEDIQDIGCSKIFLGHEHTPFMNFVKQINDLSIYRCGSLVRNSANTSNLTRDIFYFTLDKDVNIIQLQGANPASEVFTEKAYKQENLERTYFIKNISEVIDKYTNNVSVQSKFSLKQVLEEIHTPDNCMQYINNIYKAINEVLL